VEDTVLGAQPGEKMNILVSRTWALRSCSAGCAIPPDAALDQGKFSVAVFARRRRALCLAGDPPGSPRSNSNDAHTR
jgi:hypothetical protein